MTEPAAQPTTVEGAQARLAEAASNKEFGAKLLAGDVETSREFRSLSTLAAGLQKQPGSEELAAISAKQADDRHAVSFIKGVRESGVDVRDQVLSDVITGAKVSQQEHEAAKAWMARHLADQEWGKRLLAGDMDARRDHFLASVILSSEIKETAA